MKLAGEAGATDGEGSYRAGALVNIEVVLWKEAEGKVQKVTRGKLTKEQRGRLDPTVDVNE